MKATVSIANRMLVATQEGTSLADFLAGAGLPLNTRCAQRGVCGGCEVLVLGAEPRIIKACRHRLRDGDRLELSIPPRSLLSYPPAAISDFETLVPAGREPLFGRRLGLALDLGTTTVALLLADPDSDEPILSRATALNAQISLGDNVLSRIAACQENPANILRLRADFWERTFRPLLASVLSEAGIEATAIGGIAVAGNTTMLHLACGVDPTPMGRAPFTPQFLTMRQFGGTEFGLPADWEIVFLPGRSAFVGADIVAGAVCCGLSYVDEPTLFVDIGTNGELLLCTPNTSTASATAAGPAFEGCGLQCGMRASRGAIGHLSIAEHSLETHLEVIDGTPNDAILGIAGSAYVDFLAEGRRAGLLMDNGRFDPVAVKTHPHRFSDGEIGRNFLLRDGNAALRIGEVDVALLLQAKAAIAAGIETLLVRHNLRASDLRRVFVAGGFGRHLSVVNALRCGLLPGFCPDQIQAVGNTSLGGAYLALLDKNLLQSMADFQADTLELNQDPAFEDRFIDHLGLK